VTEAEWLASDDPGRMLAWYTARHVRSGGGGPLASDRKLRLFACACCREAWDRISDRRIRAAVVVAENYADGRASEGSLGGAHRYLDLEAAHEPVWALAYLATCRDERPPDVTAARDLLVSPAVQAALLRCIVGDPWRPAPRVGPDDEDPWTRAAWAVARQVARGIYDAHDFASLPVLADALEEAGCGREEACSDCAGTGKPFFIGGRFNHPHHGCALCGGSGRLANPLLAHLRGPGPHARGCWALDLLLGKE
jgi:hypothetical protein